MLKYDLIESFSLKVELNNGTQNQLQGFYTINEDSLYALSSEVVSQLITTGYMQAAYMMIASMSNFRSLIERKNKRL
jgi:hypothetical protein